MKRVWIAIILISTSLFFSIWEQNEIKGFYEKVNTYCESTNQKEAISNIKNLWKEKNDILYAFSQHDLLEHLAEGIEQLDINDSEEKTKSALKEIRAQNNVYYQNHRLTFSNIF